MPVWVLCFGVAPTVSVWPLCFIVNFTVPVGASAEIRLFPTVADPLPFSEAADVKRTEDRFKHRAGRASASDNAHSF